MKKHKRLKVTGLVVAGLLIIIIGLVGWTKLEYGPHPPIAHKRVTITLPFTPENEATNLIPMGETIAHPFPGGHPGIDFQWDHSVPLIAVANGTVTGITKASDMGEPVTYLNLNVGEYQARYKELDKVADGIKTGSKVKQGDILAYPHCHTQDGHEHCQLHWEFAYSWPLVMVSGPDRLCPLTYFDASALQRINKIWDSVPANDKFKQGFPYICSNVYHNHDQ